MTEIPLIAGFVACSTRLDGLLEPVVVSQSEMGELASTASEYRMFQLKIRPIDSDHVFIAPSGEWKAWWRMNSMALHVASAIPGLTEAGELIWDK